MEASHAAGEPEAEVAFGRRGAGGEGQFSGKPAIAGGGHGEGEMGLLPGPATGEGQEPADGPLDPVRIAGEAHPVDEIEHDGMTWLERPAAAGGGLDQLGGVDLALDEAEDAAVEAESIVNQSGDHSL